MTHPSLYSVQDSIDALSAALDLEGLTIMQRQILTDMRDDLHDAVEINTFSDVVELANKRAKKGYY